MACPDQELSTSYHYLIDALKTQDIKCVVVEALFLTNPPTEKREYYNRLALDYMPLSWNKIRLAAATAAFESPYMQEIDSSAPNTVATFASYLFPLLRYHFRTDITMADVAYYSSGIMDSYLKGGYAAYNYSNYGSLDVDITVNGDSIRDYSAEYFDKIQELCEEKGIELLLIKSPNVMRWDEDTSALIHDFAEERGVDYLDLEEGDYGLSLDDYGLSTGRLNVHGMKKITTALGTYLLDNYDLPTHRLDEKTDVEWQECIDKFYEEAYEAGAGIAPGTIGRIYNEVEGVRFFWYPVEGAETYSILRCDEETGNFKVIATTEELSFVDDTAENGKGYTYQIVPREGEYAGTVTDTRYYVFLEQPSGFKAYNDNGIVHMEWEESDATTMYRLQRRNWNAYSYTSWDYFEGTTYENRSCSEGTLYYYGLCARVVVGENNYYSAPAIAYAMPISTPEIYRVSAGNSTIGFYWETIGSNIEDIEVWRRSENEDEFTLYEITENDGYFTDENVEAGTEYFYKVVAIKVRQGRGFRSDKSNTVSGVPGI